MRDHVSEIFNVEQARHLASSVHWLGLDVLETKVKNNVGIVEFVARYKLSNGVVEVMCEKSEFKRCEGRWYYIDSLSQDHKMMGAHKAPGLNAPCACGRGKKYKHCRGC